MKRFSQLFVTVFLLAALMSFFTPASAAGDTHALSFAPADALFSPDGSTLYLSDKAGKAVHSVNLATFEQKSISFDLMPESIYLKDGKLYVSLCTQAHSSNWSTEEQSGAFAVIDCASFTKTAQYTIAIDPYDIVVSDAGIVYIASGSGQWTSIHGYDQEGEIVATGQIRFASTIEYSALYNRIYAITSDTSPRNMSAFRIKEDGSFEDTGLNMGTSYNWPYHGTYKMGTAFRISPDGAYIFNSSGNVFACDPVIKEDMKFKVSLDKTWSDLAFSGDRFYTALDSAKLVYVYDYKTFEGRYSYETRGFPRYLTVKGDTLISLSAETLGGSKYFIEKLDLTDPQSTLTTEVTKTNLTMKDGHWLLSAKSAAKAVFDGSMIYIADQADSAVYAIDTDKLTETKITFPMSPNSLSCSGGELLVGFGDNGVVAILDAGTYQVKERHMLGNVFYDAAFGKDGCIYIIEHFGSSAFSYARSFSKVTGQQLSEERVYPRNGKLVPHPVSNKFYWADIGVSPQDLNTLRYENGVIKESYDSPYHGTTKSGPIGPVIKISPDGKNIYTSAGSVFVCGDAKGADMLYKGSSPVFTDLAFDQAKGRLFASQGRPNLIVYNDSAYVREGFIKTAFPVKHMELNGGTILALSSEDGAYYLELLDSTAILQVAPEKITISSTTPVFMKTGGSLKLNPVVVYNDGTSKALTGADAFSSNDTDVVTVSDTGVLTALKTGHAVITLKAEGYVEPIDVYVDFGITSLTAGGQEIGFSPDKTSYAVLLPAGTTQVPEVLYTVSDGALATHTDASSLPGTTTITVTDQGKTFAKTYSIYFYLADSEPSSELPFVFQGYYEVKNGMVHLTAWLEDNPNYQGPVPTEFTVIVQLMSYADEQPVLILTLGTTREINVSFSEDHYAITMVMDRYGQDGYIGRQLAEPKRT